VHDSVPTIAPVGQRAEVGCVRVGEHVGSRDALGLDSTREPSAQGAQPGGEAFPLESGPEVSPQGGLDPYGTRVAPAFGVSNDAPPFASIEPMLLEQARQPFEAEGWTAELKFDGYRLLVETHVGRVRLKTRRGADATRWYPELRSLAALGGRHVLDGEVAVLDQHGRSDFDALHARSRLRGWRAGAAPVVFCAFDILILAGEDVRGWPLVERKAALRELLAKPPEFVLYVQDVPGEVAGLYQQAVAWQLEGIVAKQMASVYQSGVRSPDWLKIKRPGAIPPGRFRR
jgi:bifunctional non-homologous end joining protein LigD